MKVIMSSKGNLYVHISDVPSICSSFSHAPQLNTAIREPWHLLGVHVPPLQVNNVTRRGETYLKKEIALEQACFGMYSGNLEYLNI